MHDTFIRRINEGSATIFAAKIWDVIKLLENEAQMYHPSFDSPVGNPKLVLWEEYGHDCGLQGSGPYFFKLLEAWYVTLRIVVQTWEEEEQLVLKWLQISSALKIRRGFSDDLK